MNSYNILYMFESVEVSIKRLTRGSCHKYVLFSCCKFEPKKVVPTYIKLLVFFVKFDFIFSGL